MTRIFLSHSSKDNPEAIALKRWLVAQDPPLAKEIFLDLDGCAGIPPGVKWKDALRLASHRAEAVVCLLSKTWEGSTECTTEFRTAENLGKRIFPARLEPETGSGVTRDWQFVDLFAGDASTPMTPIDIGTEGPVTLATHGLLQLRDEIVGKRVGPDSFVWPPGGPGSDKHADRAPYRGWEPLEDIDAGVFFGRDAELLKGLDELRRIRGVAGTQLFVILAASGAGKSSFLRAGLLPRLRRDDRTFLPLDVVRPERNVLTGENGLARSIQATRARLELQTPDLGDIKEACLTSTETVYDLLGGLLRAATQRLGGDVPPPTLILPVDQGEELFATDAGTEAARFLELIAELAPPAIDLDSATPTTQAPHDLPLIVAVTIRTDRHHQLQDAPQLAGVPTVTFADLKAMPPHQFREVIVGPAQRATAGGRALDVDPALVDQLVADCASGADTLPLLALTLSRLYEDYGGDGDLRLDEYVRMGGMARVVETEIDQLLSRDPDERRREMQLLREAFIPSLVTLDGDQPMRRVADWNEIPEAARPLLDKFVSRRLLVRRGQEGVTGVDTGGVVEVALESLLRQWSELRKWLDEERKDLKKAAALERDAREWTEHGASENWLLEGDRVTDAERLLQRPDFEKRLLHVEEFIRQSRAREIRRDDEKRRQLRMRRWLRASVAAVLALALVASAIVAKIQHDKIDNEQRNKAGLTLMSTAEQMLNGGQAGGDALALNLLLAAERLGAPATELQSLADGRRDLVLIMDNPSRAPVQNVIVSHDGRFIASTGTGSDVQIWDAVTGVRRAQLATGGRKTALPEIAFDSADAVLATGNDGGIVQVWDVESAKQISAPVKLDGRIAGLAFSPDGHRIAAGTVSRNLYVWDRGGTVDASRPVYQRPNPLTDNRWPMSFSPDGDSLAFEDVGRNLRLLKTDSTQPVSTASANTPPPATASPSITNIAFSPSGDRIAVGRQNGTIELVDPDNLSPLSTLTENSDNLPVNGLAFSPADGALLASASDDNTVRVWDAHTFQAVGQPIAGHHGAVTSVQFLATPGDRPLLVSGSVDGSIREWNPSFALPFATGQGHIRSIAYSPDGYVAVGCSDGTISIWNPEIAKPIRLLEDRGGGGTMGGTNPGRGCPAEPPQQTARHAIASLAFNPSNGEQIASGSGDGSLKLWNVTTGSVESLNQTAEDHPRPPVTSVAFSHDGGQVVAGGYGRGTVPGLVQLWDSQSGQLRTADVAYPVWTVAFSPDVSKARFVTGSGDPQRDCLQFWDARELQIVGQPMYGQPQQRVYVARFSPDGQYVVSGHSDGKILLWDANSGQPWAANMNGDQNPVLSLAFSDKGGLVASSDSVGKVRIWDTAQKKPIGAPFTGNPAWLTSLAFNPDNSQIVSSSYDGDLHLWPVQRDLKTTVCGMLSTTMSEPDWEQYVSKQYQLGYQDLCA